MDGRAGEMEEETVVVGTQTLQGPASGSCMRSAGNPEYRRLPLTPRTALQLRLHLQA